jgi:hypothetical protein
MCSRCHRLPIFLIALTLLVMNRADARVIRIASDPNNLPFSNEKCEGFENKIAELIARELGPKFDTRGARSAGDSSARHYRKIAATW